MDLEYPVSVSEIYLARGEEVNVVRPIMQGDVFPGVSIPGVDDDEENLGLITAHPCSMRRGAELLSRLKVARIRIREKFPLHKWADGYFGLMPLPNLRGAEDEGFYVAVLEESGRVPTEELDITSRLACLSPRGLMLLQQRMVFSDTRVKVETSKLMERSEPVLDEADLLEEWNENLISPEDTELLVRLHEEAKIFDDLMSSAHTGEQGETFTLRRRLLAPEFRSSVRKVVRTALVERAAEIGQATSGSEPE